MLPEILYTHQRQFSARDRKGYKPFVWSNDKSKSFLSFEECFESWQEKAENDPKIDLKKMFNLKVDMPNLRRRRSVHQAISADLLQIEMYAEIEDMFDCSGMCRPALFYFGRSINDGYPLETCLMSLKEYLDNEAGSYGDTTYFTAMVALFLFFLHFGLYFRQKMEDRPDHHYPS